MISAEFYDFRVQRRSKLDIFEVKEQIRQTLLDSYVTPEELDSLFKLLKFKSIKVTVRNIENETDQFTIILSGGPPYTIEKVKEKLNGQIFAFDGLEVQHI